MKITIEVEVEVEPKLTAAVYDGVVELVDSAGDLDPVERESMIMGLLARAAEELRPWVDDDGQMTITFDTLTGVPRIVSAGGRDD